MRPFCSPPAQAGFTYLWLLFAVAIVGAAAAALGERATVAIQRDKEAELAFRGQEIARAIAAYWAATPSATRELPASLAELTEDRRGPVVVRHLRRVYADPFTGLPDWQVIASEDGRHVRGVRSRSDALPFAVTGIDSAASGVPRRISDRLFVFEGDIAASASDRTKRSRWPAP